jgi:hypothetical protein
MATEREESEAGYHEVNAAIARVLAAHGYTDAAIDESLRADLQTVIVGEIGEYLRKRWGQ